METIVIPVLLSAADKLFSELSTIMTLKKQNVTVVRDIEEFKQSLEADLRLVETKRKTLQDDQAWAIESLSKDLEDASMYLQSCRKQGRIQGLWDAKRTSNELTALRQKLSHNFQVKLFFTSLELIIDREKRTEDFHSKLAELSTLSATRSINEINEIKGLLKPLTMGQKVQETRFRQLRAEIRALSTPLQSESDNSLDTEKFLQDILASLAESVPSFDASEDDNLYYDPFTYELMFDPVKCGDGRTYDRFSVFKYNMESNNNPLVILCPDESVRIAVFNKFRHEQPDRIMRSRRNEYRTEALAIADAEEFGEAIVRLDNVLQWDPNDSKCLHKRDKMRDFYRQEALNLAGNGNRKEALDMLETVKKWFPGDREISYKLEMLKRENSTTSDSRLQQLLAALSEIVSATVPPALVAPVPVSPMDKHDGREGGTSNEEKGRKKSNEEKEIQVGISVGDNSQPNHPSETVRSKAPSEHVHNDHAVSSPTFQNDGSKIPGGDQHSKKVNERYLWWNPLNEDDCIRYLACLTCQGKACGNSQAFARDVKPDDDHLYCICCVCCLPLSFLFCLDCWLSIFSRWLCCHACHSDVGDFVVHGWLRQIYSKQFQ